MLVSFSDISSNIMTNEANSVNNVILPEIVYDKYYKYLYFEVLIQTTNTPFHDTVLV